MPRLFVAIDLPDQVKSAVAGFAREIPAAKWVGSSELHLTLRFIGEVDPQTLQSVRDALASIAFPRFSLTVCGVGHFPPGRQARVVWVGLDPSPALLDLQREVERALVEAGIEPEGRGFSPHITLARLKESAPGAVERFEKAHLGFSCAPFEVDRFILYASQLTRSGAIHTQEAVYPCR